MTHNANLRTPLEQWIHDRVGAPEPEEHPSVAADRERNDRSIAHTDHVASWREFVSSFSAGELQLDGAQLKAIREAAGLSLATTAEVVGVPAEVIASVENGKSTAPYIEAPLKRFAAAAA